MPALVWLAILQMKLFPLPKSLSRNICRFAGTAMKIQHLKEKIISIKPLYRWVFPALFVLVVFFWFSLPKPLFRVPTSTVIFDSHGQLLGARIAADGQWRFKASGQVPEKFAKCLVQFEDRHFFWHPGVNLFSLFRALRQNISQGRVISGGSTLTMQTIRLARKGKDRSIIEKIIEMWLALRLELTHSKKEILSLYASHAPFGGNVVGIDAGAWRYFGRSAENLSWAEAATLAVLPNSPALIHPGRNRAALEKKRNRLLQALSRRGEIDEMSCSLAMDESLPLQPLPLPGEALHLVNRMSTQNPGEVVATTIVGNLQAKINEIVARHSESLQANGIYNAAVLVLEVKTGNVLAYIGNTTGDGKGQHGNDVDVIISPRSSGSILKPLLYAAMLDEGELLPGTLVADIPTSINSYTPKNFNISYDGAVSASEALIRSLNVPSVRLLNSFGLDGFYLKLKEAGFSTLVFPPAHYGLSLILGGAEVSLWDLCKVYRGFSNTLNCYNQNFATYPKIQFPSSVLIKDQKSNDGKVGKIYSAAAIYCTLEAMKEVRRPEGEAGWESFLSASPVAYKTGTSFGFRDAWAVGLTTEYVVGVWVGNADGEGRPGLTGISAAAPIMFEIFNYLPPKSWFEPPWDELVKIPVCRQSGMRPSVICPETDSILVPAAGLETAVCNYHILAHFDQTQLYRVNDGCYPSSKIITKPWFVLPPAMEWFYRSKNPFYKSLPPWLPGCNSPAENPMQLIWPNQDTRIYVPHELNGSLGQVVFEAAHASPGKTIFWYVDENFIGTTSNPHKMGLQPPLGKHLLVLMDENGNMLRKAFEIVGK